jgi:hypothetical protein
MMKLQKLFKQLRFRRREPPAVPNAMQVASLQMTMEMVAQTQEQELGCDEAYAFFDTYAERVNRGEDVAALMPLVHHHLAMCPDCREEFDALLRALEATSQ